MRVMIISHEKDLNGATRSMYELICSLKNKVEFYVVVPECEGNAFEKIRSTGVTVIVKKYYRWVMMRDNDHEWNCWRQKWQDTHDSLNDETAKELAEIVVSEGIDIIHTNVGVLDIGARIKKYTSIKHIWHFREFGDLDFNMFPLVSRKQYFETINNYSDLCIFNSKAILNYYNGIESKKALVYNGVDEKQITTEHTRHEGINILIAGHVSEGKGHRLAVRACKELVEEGCEDLKLIVAGTINDKDRVEFEKELNDHIEIYGFVSNMNELRKITDIALMCSKNEAFGRVTVEAMFAGIPVIGSDSGGTPEIIPSENEGGLLFETGNCQSLKEKIKVLYDNPDRRVNIGARGRKRALELFTANRCANEVFKCYCRVLEA